MVTLRFLACVIIVWSLSVFVSGQCLTVPVSLEERVAEADTIVLGRVVSQQAFWDKDNRNIHTCNILEVMAYLKGEGGRQIALITLGGFVGNQGQITYPSLKVNLENEYILMLNEAPNEMRYSGLDGHQPVIRQTLAYADAQGALLKQSGMYHDLYVEGKATEQQIFNRIESLTGEPARRPDGQVFQPRRDEIPDVTGASARAITNISPDPTNAGTIEASDFVTITGSGFGAESSVLYANADNGGATLIASGVASDNISWSSTQVVNKPAGDAGTGTVSVNGQTGSVTIDYSLIDINSDFYLFGEVTRQRYHLVDVDGSGGLVFTYNTSFDANGPAVDAFERALTTWRCSTYVNFGVNPSTSSIATAAQDGVNIVTFDGSLPSGVLGRATSRFSAQGNASCQQSDTVWWLYELDMQFSPSPASGTWNFGPGATNPSQYDFQSVATHELGHGHGLGHRIDSGTLMHYAISNGADIRTPHPREIDGANAKMAYSTGSLCFIPSSINGPMVALTPGNCSLEPSDTDLAVTKTADDLAPCEADVIIYTITVTNNGPGQATNVALTDHMPTGVTRTATPPNAGQGTYNDGTGVWTIGTIDPPNSVTLQLEVTLDTGTGGTNVTNETNGLTLDQTDTNAGNNQGSVTVQPLAPVQITQDPSNLTVCLGQTAIFEVTAAGSNPEYQWYKDGGLLPGETDPVLSFQANAGDAGDYHCEVENQCNADTSASASLTITAGTFGVSIEADRARGLSDVCLIATVECASPPYDLVWENLLTQETSTDNPWQVADLTETTMFEVRVTKGVDTVSDTATVLVSANPLFFDYNGDGFNNELDVQAFSEFWRTEFIDDPNADQFVDIRDFLYINVGPIACP